MFLTLKVKFKVQNFIISFLGNHETCLKFWTTLQQNCGLDLEGQGQGQLGQGPKLNHFYSRQRRNLAEILNDIVAKLWIRPWWSVKVKEANVQNIIISIPGKDETFLKFWTTL